jgi:internalin A
MTEAEKAYEAAQKRVAEAKADGRHKLDFDKEAFRALEALPPEIGELVELQVLDCDNTQVADLAPIAGMTALRTLGLSGTQVADLAPIAGMTALRTLGLSGTQVADLAPIAGMTALRNLWLDGTQVADLTPIAGMTALEILYLENTQVADISPIAGFAALKALDLTGCPVVDLRPLRGLRGLAHDLKRFTGVRFAQSGAAQVDARIAEIEEIEDNEARGQALLAYLDSLPKWPEPLPSPPYPKESIPEPDALARIGLDGDRLELDPSSPTEAERDERLKQILHERLKVQTRDLCQKAGNQFFRLAARARALEVQVERDFADLDMLPLHLAIDDIRKMEELGREDEESGDFPPEVQIALADVLGTGPGLTLGNPDVDLLVERANRRRSAPPVPESELAAQDALSARLIEATDAIGDRLRAVEEAVVGSEGAEDREMQKATHRSLLWRIAAYAGGGVVMGAGLVAGDAAIQLFSPMVVEFVKTNAVLLKDAAATYGPRFLDWFSRALTKIKM